MAPIAAESTRKPTALRAGVFDFEMTTLEPMISTSQMMKRMPGCMLMLRSTGAIVEVSTAVSASPSTRVTPSVRL